MNNQNSRDRPPISAAEKWWGNFKLPYESWSCWQISLLSLYVWRSRVEWHFVWGRDGDPLDDSIAFTLGGVESPDRTDLEHARYILADKSYQLNLQLQLADRSMVARPEVPIFVPVGERAVIYVSTGIWIQAHAGNQPLVDIPVFRPSDTWFGPNTREGELCYFCRTRARTSRTGFAAYPHRATTQVTVINQGMNLLRIDRLRVPSPLLSLYIDEGGEFVTDSLTYLLHSDVDEASVKIDSSKKKGNQRLSEPRKTRDDNPIAATLAKWFG